MPGFPEAPLSMHASAAEATLDSSVRLRVQADWGCVSSISGRSCSSGDLATL